jgi:hypothetical protein
MKYYLTLAEIVYTVAGSDSEGPHPSKGALPWHPGSHSLSGRHFF